MMRVTSPFRTRLAQTATDLRAAQALRYRVFVAELGADGPSVDHAAQVEIDDRDGHADHLLLEDLSLPGSPVVGVYRIMSQAQARAAGGFATAQAFDLTPLVHAGRPLLELGRSCLLPAYRGGPAMMHLFAGLARLMAGQPDPILFGLASFHGTNTAALAAPLSYLQTYHLAPPALRVRVVGSGTRYGHAADRPDRKVALRQMPPLIKAYLRLGGVVGDGVCVDAAFNTTDVCMILDAAALTADRRMRLTAATVR